MSGLREGRWVCTYCGAECRGRDEGCAGLDGGSGCGAARQPGVRFYLPGQSPYLTDPDLIADARSGADWHCDHCGGANKGAIGTHPVTACAHCGNARESTDPVTPVRDLAPGQTPATAEAVQPPRPSPNRRKAAPPNRPPARSIRIGLIAAAVLSLLFFAWSVLFAAYPAPMMVTGLSWERTLTVEAYRTVQEEGWSAPSDARVYDRDQRVRSWREVLDRMETRTREVSERVQVGTESYGCGTRDLGNGYFQDLTCTRPAYQTRMRTETYQEPVYRREPVYDTWLSWEAERWVAARTERASGTTPDRAWPEPELAANERAGARTERLEVDLGSGEDLLQDHVVPDPVWIAAVRERELLVIRDWWGRVRDVTVVER
jgi:hypothetical protein